MTTATLYDHHLSILLDRSSDDSGAGEARPAHSLPTGAKVELRGFDGSEIGLS